MDSNSSQDQTRGLCHGNNNGWLLVRSKYWRYILLSKTDMDKKWVCLMMISIWNIEFMISHTFKFTKVSLRKIIKKYCVVDFVFSIKFTNLSLRKILCFQFRVFPFFLIYGGVIAKKIKNKSDIGVVYTSSVLFWNDRKICVNVDSDGAAG